MARLVAALVLGFVLVTAAPASARRCAGVTAPDTVRVDGALLRLNGMGIREATVLQVDVYVAALYLEETGRDANAILGSDKRKQIVLRFVRDVDAEDIAEAFEEGFRRNAPRTPRAKIARLVSFVEDMREGQTMTLTYVPGRGTELRIQGRAKGTIDGAEFARSVYSLFIGPRPPNRGLRVGLLGGRCG